MILKQVFVGVSNSYNVKPDTLTNGIMYVPQSGLTKAEIQNLWNLIPERASIPEVCSSLLTMGVGGGGFPCFFKGAYTGTGSYTGFSYYNNLLSLVPYTAFIEGTFTTAKYIHYLSKDKTGSLNAQQSYGMSWGATHAYPIASGAMQLGIFTTGNSTVGMCLNMFISSDNKVGTTYVSFYDKRSCVLSWFSDADSTNIITWINRLPDITTDPYADGGDTSTSEPTGDFDDTSDPIEFPTLPSITATDTGLITLYNPSLQEVKDLANYMWTNPAFDLSAWKKIFADPIDAILGLSIVPVAVPDGGTRAIAVGNLSTNVRMNVAAQQYIELQCGSLNVNEFWSSYLDYDPYTKAEIYLPYCGTHQLSVDDIMNKTIEVRYHIDILSGSCCAYVKCGDSVLYQFIGQCSSSIPVASGDFSEIVSSAINAALAVGSVIATGGASAPFALPTYTANAVNILKEKVQKSGSLSGTGGMLAIQKPYLILTRPRQAHPEKQNHYTGYPSFITENLSDLSGYTEIEEIHLENVQATDSELNEIVSLLESGVIF